MASYTQCGGSSQPLWGFSQKGDPLPTSCDKADPEEGQRLGGARDEVGNGQGS